MRVLYRYEISERYRRSRSTASTYPRNPISSDYGRYRNVSPGGYGNDRYRNPSPGGYGSDRYRDITRDYGNDRFRNNSSGDYGINRFRPTMQPEEHVLACSGYGRKPAQPMYRGTIHASASFDEVAAAEALDKAMRGSGADKQKIVNVLVSINNAQRQMIRTPYKTRYGKDLEAELKKELGGDLEDLIASLMQTPSKEDVLEIHRAVKGLGTNERILIEILATRTNEEMEYIRNTFFATYSKKLEDQLAADTSGDFRRLLIILAQGARDETDHSHYNGISQDTQNLIKSADKKSGVDKFDAFKILATSSPRHLVAIFDDYEKLTGLPIEKGIEKEFSGDVKNLLLALAMIARSKPMFFAHQIHNAVKGIGTRDKDLIRILVTRSEIDLDSIQQEYERIFNKSLVNVVKEECKGPYMEGLLCVVKGNKSHGHSY